MNPRRPWNNIRTVSQMSKVLIQRQYLLLPRPQLAMFVDDSIQPIQPR